MTNPYGGPGNPAPATTHSGLAEVITIVSAWLGAALACAGSFFAVNHFRVADRIGKPKVTDDTYDAWKIASEFHAVLEVLLIVSALMAVALAVGSLLSIIGKPVGRQLEIIGGAWVFLGGLFSVTYGGDHGLAVGASFPAYLIIGGAALGLISLVVALTRPSVSRAPTAYIQQPPVQMHYQPPRP
ncbi:hypothetical protein F3087_05330 [Nocardia colli]|uniref:Uncharacterized protein n=1 Tax=Nocardia colli TaxID=2545717 RepID=A0A5N0EP63_9NOCA|nr:hypothetical protein [Nocardia colli]KAA8890676.1 hypothetical protein F3087_05330 [Nocardia colli]